MITRKQVLGALTAAAVLIAVFGAGGCASNIQSETSVPDSTGTFHFMIPAKWQPKQTSGMVVVYAGEKLPVSSGPETNALDAAGTLLVLTNGSAETSAVPKELTAMIQNRAKTRGWKSQQISAPKEARIGDRAAWQADVKGVDAQGQTFAGRFYLVRTSGREVFIAALASPQNWGTFASAVDRVLSRWYWQIPADAGSGAASSGTP